MLGLPDFSMLRKKIDIVHALYLILMFPFRALYYLILRPVFFILWHPITLSIITIFWYFEVRQESIFSFTFPTVHFPPDELMYVLLVIYGLGVGSHIARYFIRSNAFPVFVISLITALGMYVSLATSSDTNALSKYLTVTQVLLGLIATGTSLCAVYLYMSSKRPGPLASLPRAVFRNIFSSIGRGFSWLSTHPFIVLFLLLQSGSILFLFFRLASIESRLGGSVFSLCNADTSIATINTSVIRIASEDVEGTGMIIREDGIILTNAHVIGKDPSPKVIFADYSFKPAKVLFRDDDKDIALIKVDGNNYSTVTFEDPKIVPKRTEVYVHGYPLGTEMRGDATTSKFSFVAVRSQKGIPTEIVQLDGLGTGGASGSPVITSCGRVIGMFTSGIEGMSFAISSKSIEEAIQFIKRDQSEWPKPPEYPLEPDKSAIEAVRAFYTFLKMRDFKRAYLMQTPERVQSSPLSEWLKGYDKNINFTVISIIKAPIQPSPTPTPMPESEQKPSTILMAERVIVRIRTLDLEGQDIVVKYFEGPWIVVFDGEFWRLSQSNIQPVEKPGWDWFW